MNVKFTKKFEKQYNKAPKKIRNVFEFRLKLFMSDKLSPTLNNHHLTGKFAGYRSINVTSDWRAIFRGLEGGEIVYFDLLGTHSQLYR